MWEFEEELEFVWVMGGLAHSYERANLLEVVSQWLEDAAASRMPCDPRIWTKNPLDSTYPACRAAKAAAEQGPDAAYRYLRTLREGIMCEVRKLDDDESLIDAAERAGIDRARFATDLRSDASAEAFDADLEEVRDPPQEARDAGAVHRDKKGRERIGFPSALFIGNDTGQHVWAGEAVDVAKMRDAALQAGAKAVNEGSMEPAEAIRRFGRCATHEIEVLAEKGPLVLGAELFAMARDGQLVPIRTMTGALWELPEGAATTG
jgi:hypothetical protein